MKGGDACVALRPYSLIRHNTISILFADNSRKACFLQTLQRTLCDATACFAIRVTNIVITAATSFEHPEELSIKRSRIELSCQAKRRWIVDNTRKTIICVGVPDLVGITHKMMD